MPRVSKYSEEQIKAMLAEGFGATCGGEGEGAGGEPTAEKEGISYQTLLVWKRKYFPASVKTRGPRKGGVRKVGKKAATAIASNGAGKSLDTKKEVRRLFLAWISENL